jgi:hypothetical protein
MAKPLTITGLAPVRRTAPGLSRHEQIVLEVVCRFPNRRAITDRIDGERQMTRADWSAARASLIGKRLLNAAGEITLAGRVIVGDTTC